MKKIQSISIDICVLLKNIRKIGWKYVKRQSIHRMLYLCSVLFTFKYENEKNPFDDYEFLINLNGPSCINIDKSLLFLETNEIVKDINDSFLLIEENIPDISIAPRYELKCEWIKIITYILGVYGENKIYDFIFEDPEYQYKLLSNTNSLNIDKNNETTRNLQYFKKAFEESLSKDIDLSTIDNQKYLTLYFDYVFSKIIKGEDIK